MADAPHIMIVESRYYEEIAQELITSVIKELDDIWSDYVMMEGIDQLKNILSSQDS